MTDGGAYGLRQPAAAVLHAALLRNGGVCVQGGGESLGHVVRGERRLSPAAGLPQTTAAAGCTQSTVRVGFLVVFWLLAVTPFASAHAPDTSYLRAVVSRHGLELRFTFDLAALHRIVRFDADGDSKVTRAEVEAVAPDIADFLGQTITLELNGKKAGLGTPQPPGWPVDAGESVEEKNYGQTLVHFTFAQSSQNLIEDFYVLYEVFPQLGAAHRAVADIEQEGKHLEVVFTQFEPDYLYDTFWRAGMKAEDADVAVRFRSGVAYAWSHWWPPVVLAFLAAFTARWAVQRCLGVVGLVATIGLTILAPGHEVWALGLVVGFFVVVIIVSPVRIMVADWRRWRG